MSDNPQKSYTGTCAYTLSTEEGLANDTKAVLSLRFVTAVFWPTTKIDICGKNVKRARGFANLN